MSRNATLCILDDKKEKARHRLPFGSKLKFKDESSVKMGDVLAEWDPFTLPIIAQIDGYIVFKDLEEGITAEKLLMSQPDCLATL